ncbi:MAG: hypothetical protein ACO2PN_13325 [Pyrobaculum sp.]
MAGECPGGWGYGLGGSLSLFLDAAYLSAGFRLFGFDAGGAVLGAFLGAWVAVFGKDRAAGGFGGLLLAAATP